jgi:multidrug efflux pump subunit AcrA (membrane-fusion protein)
MIIPAGAVVNRERLYYVYVIHSGIAHLRLVSVGSSDSNRVEILSGLDCGDKIAVTGVTKLTDNCSVAEAK